MHVTPDSNASLPTGESVLSRVVNWMIETKPIYSVMKMGAMNAMKGTTQKAGIDWDAHVRRMAATPEVRQQQQQEWLRPQQGAVMAAAAPQCQHTVLAATTANTHEPQTDTQAHDSPCWPCGLAAHQSTPCSCRCIATPLTTRCVIWAAVAPCSCSGCARSLSSSRTPTWPTLPTTQCPSTPMMRATLTGRCASPSSVPGVPNRCHTFV